MEVIVLPPGLLGLELEPASISIDYHKSASSNPLSVGCRVRDWKSDPYGLSSKLTPGAVIQAVDGTSVAELPFKDIIKILGSSSSRCIEYLRFAPNTSIPNPKGETPSNVADKENRNTPTDAADLKYVKSNSQTGVLKRGVLRDRSADGKVHLLNSKLKVQAEELQHLQKDLANVSSQLANKEQEVRSLEGKVLSLKQEGRSSDGKFALAMFQLRKRMTAETSAAIKEAKTNATGCANEDLKILISDRIVHAGKMHNVMTELCRGSDDKLSTAHEPDDDASSLSRKLEVQRRLNERLTAQMHAWVDAQIKLQLSLAEADVAGKISAQAYSSMELVKNPGPDACLNIAVVAEQNMDAIKYSSFVEHGKSFAISPSVSVSLGNRDENSDEVSISNSVASVSVAKPIEEKLLQPSTSNAIRPRQRDDLDTSGSITSRSVPCSAADAGHDRCARKTPGSNVRFAIDARDARAGSSIKDKNELANIMRGLCQYGTPAPEDKSRSDGSAPITMTKPRNVEKLDSTPADSTHSKLIIPLTAYRLGSSLDASSNRVERAPMMEVSESCVSEMTSESISIHQLSVCDQESDVIRQQPLSEAPIRTTVSESSEGLHRSVMSMKNLSSFHRFPQSYESPSVTAMRSRADKLRVDHELIRNDLQRFKAIIQHVKSEVHDTLSYAI